ncbi:septation ring formation regulator EzrA [Aerococcus sp. UMB1112A]|uniref:septation ring formation regulator EzrA n=1 Tax=Aerococcus sp. UMB1112A TaxID=3050609 RepID=UPI0025508DDB|nr:septation ring formation regulator EzrA [Aerococcus sp. UMB1112A]MDK8502141.1 septation ring formation regulator EzrA [Aerococcus sp. UMB1112A]
MELLIALLVVILIVLISYGILYYLSKKQTKTNQELDEQKQEIMAIPVADKLYTIKNKNVTGKTGRALENEQANWQTVTQYKLPEIEAVLVSAQDATDKLFSKIKARQMSDKAEDLLQEARTEVEGINQRLEKLLDQEDANASYHEELYDRYAKIRKKLLAHSYAYGPSQETLEKNLSYIELDFTKYNELMNDGDFIGAHEILEQIQQDIESLEGMMEEIPSLLTRIDEEYLAQYEDLNQGYKAMLDEDYRFPMDVDIPEEINQVDKVINNAKEAIARADLDEAQAIMERAEVQIDRTYELMEAELRAKQYIGGNQGAMQQTLSKVHQSNRYAILEIDRVAQNYQLSGSEMSQMRDYADQIDRLQETIDYTNQQEGNHTIAYSDMETRYRDSYETLAEIEKGQSKIVSSLAGLKQQEREARDQLYLYELDLRNIKRKVGQYHLPGLDPSYLDRFFACEDTLDAMRSKLNRVKLDMEEINRLSQIASEDIEYLDTEIEKTLDYVRLTETAIQYANRYRANHPEINDAVDYSHYLFNERYDYQGAYQAIVDCVAKFDSQAQSEIEKIYRADKNKYNY